MKLTEIIARAPWRQEVTYRDTWPHECVLSEKDGQRELLNAIYARLQEGEGVDCRFFLVTNRYLFIGGPKYWFNNQWDSFDPDSENVNNRASLYRDRRDCVIRHGDTGKPEDYPTNPVRQNPDSDLWGIAPHVESPACSRELRSYNLPGRRPGRWSTAVEKLIVHKLLSTPASSHRRCIRE